MLSGVPHNDTRSPRIAEAEVTANISPLAGKPAPLTSLIDVTKLVTAYFDTRPDPAVASQRVAFGTSGHRGSAFDGSCNEWHVLAIRQAVCDYRRNHDIAVTDLAGEKIDSVINRAPGDNAPIGGIKVSAAVTWRLTGPPFRNTSQGSFNYGRRP